MVLAGDTLFLAGQPVDATAIAAGNATGKAVLMSLSASDGRKVATCLLTSMPVFDGLAAAGGRLYMSTCDGKVASLVGR